MKRILKNKRGMAMESAILFMLITLMFGLLLTGVIMNTHLRVKVNNTLLSREITIEQIGENFVHDKQEFSSLSGDFTTDITANGTNYVAKGTYTDKNNKTLTLSTKKGDLLFIIVADGKITQWKYTK